MELFKVAQTLRAAATLRHFIVKQHDYYEHVQRLAHTIEDQSDLADAISAAVDAEGRVLDSASPTLAAIRKQIVRSEAAIRRRLTHVPQQAATQECFHHHYVTVPPGRHLPPEERLWPHGQSVHRLIRHLRNPPLDAHIQINLLFHELTATTL